MGGSFGMAGYRLGRKGIRARAWTVLAVSSSLVAVSLVVPEVADAAGEGSWGHPNPGPAVRSVRSVAPHRVTPAGLLARPARATATSWPVAAKGSVALSGATGPGAAAPTGGRRASGGVVTGTPVSLTAVSGRGGLVGAGQVTVQVSDHRRAQAAGVDGMLVSVQPPRSVSGAVDLSVDYARFAQAYGGNFGGRLALSLLPACAWTTPGAAACRKATPLSTRNDVPHHRVSARVTLPTPARTASGTAAAAGGPSSLMVLAVAASSVATAGVDGGPGGTYAATTLKPSGSWTAGGSSGSFRYDVPVALPASASGLAPQVGLSYDSGSVDGQSATTTPQSSWVGDGWSTPSSFIEQSFALCSDSPEGSPAPKATSDKCYDGHILSMSLNGSSTALVWDAGKGVWRAKDDTGAVVTHQQNTQNGTGTWNTDYWVVTDRSGTSYYFGRNQLPGWSGNASTRVATNSVDTVPVYSAHAKGSGAEPDDPCANAAFASAVCTMAFRWNLDYVTDVHGNAMAYYYAQDTNAYMSFGGATKRSYVRDSHLDHIDYGFVDGNAYVSGKVADRVSFTTGARCFATSCTPLSSATSANWFDVPFDQVCSASATTCTAQSPTFFSTVRLTSIVTAQWNVSSGAFSTVDSWALAQSMPDPQDGTSATLWLSSVTRTGSDLAGLGSSGPVALPPTVFRMAAMPNRVDTVSDGLPGLNRYRIASVTTETGSVVTPTYTVVAPCTAPVTVSPSANHTSCYPVYWTPGGYVNPLLDWFQRYAVTSVTQTDPYGGGVNAATSYRYAGPGWHFDDNEVVKAKYRTYGQFRGYATVTDLTGDGGGPRTKSVTTYYQGLSRNNSSTVVNVTDSLGGVHEDVDQLSGKVAETTAYRGESGPLDHSTITSYWVSAPIATRSRTGLSALTSNWVAPVESFTRQAVTSGSGAVSWVNTETDTSYDDTVSSPTFGLVTASYTHTSPVDARYDSCTVTGYAPVNAAANLVGRVASAETDSVACAGYAAGSPASVPAASAVNGLSAPTTVSRPDQVVSATRTFYDDPTFAGTWPQAAPSKGDVTMVMKASTWTSNGGFAYQAVSKSTYDTVGRVSGTRDGNGQLTTIAHSDNTAGVPTGTTVTNPLGQATTTVLEPARGQALTVTDLNGVATNVHYDALGRTTGVWTANRSTSSGATYVYSYLVQNSGISAVTTKRLNSSSGYVTSVTLYDGLLRTRQTQTDTPQGGRLVSDTTYDSHGWVARTNDGWWDPNTTPIAAAPVAPTDLTPASALPQQHQFTYDGLGRTVVAESRQNNSTVSSTITVYGGDRTTVIPSVVPGTTRSDGGTTQTTITDPLGRVVELDQYTTPPTVTAPTDTFTGTWAVAGGATTATWYGYDGHNQRKTVTDNSHATWTSTYNLLGQITSKADPDAGTTLLSYDGAGRLTQSTDSRGRTTSTTYDALGRKTGLYAAPYATAAAGQAEASRLAAWTWDTDAAGAAVSFGKGHLTASTSYTGGAAGDAYTWKTGGFNVFGEPLSESMTLPASQGTLGGSYSLTHTYNATTGLPLKDVYSAVTAAGLPAESVVHTYTGALDLPTGLSSTLAGYLQSVTYDAFGRTTQQLIGGATAATQADVTNTYDPHTGLLTDQVVNRHGTSPAAVDDHAYTYDLAGNLVRDTNTRLGATATPETQCYSYDQLRRLTAAWTATDTCGATPTAADHTTVGDPLSGGTPYWTTWTFDALGQRTAQTDHAVAGGGADSTTTYGYDGNGKNQPHTLTSTTTVSGGATTGGTSYAYDSAGSTTTRNAGQGNQTLSYDDAGRLTSVATSAGTTSYVYDADGNLLLQKGPSGTTAYLGTQQLTLSSTGTLTGIRYYPLPGGGTAFRTGTGAAYGFQLTDPHGTPVLTLDNTAQSPTWRQFSPYGAPRGAQPTWPDNHGFLNKPSDPSTGLTRVGARNYDPGIGRFITLDPLFDAAQPQSLNGYSYANNNPTTISDPSGEGWYIPNGSGGSTYLPDSSEVDNCDRNCPNAGGSSGGSGSGGSTAKTPPPSPSKPAGFAAGFGAGAGAEIKDTLSGLNPANIASNIKNLLSGNVSFWDLASGMLAGLTHIDELKAIWDAWQSGDEYKFGYALGRFSVSVGEQVLGSVLGAGAGKVISDGLKAMKSAGKAEAVAADALGTAERGGADAARSCLNSFTAGTQVLMADGTTKAIEDVKVGDETLATDPETDTTKAERVVALIRHGGTHAMIKIRLQDGTTLDSTAGHPIWDATVRRFIAAEKLHTGDRIETSTGALLTITGLRSYAADLTAYNLQIDTIHTYYAGTTPVLVHNSCDDWRIEDAGDIARGHADAKHASEFPGMSASDLEDHVRDVMSNPSRTKDLNRSRRAYLGQDGETIVIHDPFHDDGGTVFRRPADLVDEYWTTKLR